LFVQLLVPEWVQGDRRAPGTVGAVPQYDLLGHCPGREKDGGLGPQQVLHALFEHRHRAVTVEVGHAVQIATRRDLREPLPHGRGPDAGQDPVASAHRGQPALPWDFGHRQIVAHRS
jgi:hypothetical protein